METLEDELINKMAMEALKYEGLELAYNHVDESMFGSLLDDLIVRNVPGHFRGFAAKHAPQLGGLDADAIIAALQDRELEVAVTPLGNADAPLEDRFFAQPFVTALSARALLEKLGDSARLEQYYFQSQNDNLSLLTEWGCPVPRALPASMTAESKFLGKQEAANLWIGTSGTTSRLHNDNYDNIYIQVAGTKRVYLIPPGFAYDVREASLKPATYNCRMELVVDEDAEPIVFPTFNPTEAGQTHGSPTMWTVDLRPGDLLFLPSLWYHQIEIVGSDLNISLNYWHSAFDDEKRWAEWNFTRQVALMLHKWKALS